MDGRFLIFCGIAFAVQRSRCVTDSKRSEAKIITRVPPLGKLLLTESEAKSFLPLKRTKRKTTPAEEECSENKGCFWEELREHFGDNDEQIKSYMRDFVCESCGTQSSCRITNEDYRNSKYLDFVCSAISNWGGWSTWSICSKTCGGGSKSRHRECINPAVASTDSPCHGNSKEDMACGESPCPVDGGWSSWKQWSECSIVNGNATQIRCRKCINPVPQYGGALCNGSEKEFQSCYLHPSYFKRKCTCRRARMALPINITLEELGVMLEELKQELTVDKDQTSLAIRAKISSGDTRKSSKAIGAVGIVMLAIPVVFLTSIDLINIWRRLTNTHR